MQKTARVLQNKPPRLITSDEWQAYEQAILAAFGECHIPPPTGLRGRPRRALFVPPEGLVYADGAYADAGFDNRGIDGRGFAYEK